MTLLKAIATTALTSFATFSFASGSYATPTQTVPVEGSHEAHLLLVQTILRHGTSISINPAFCGSPKGKGVMGVYSSRKKLMIICQDQGTPGGPQVAWTPNDLDTLRHEAQHMIQDCRLGTRHDGLLAPVYRSPIGLANATLTPNRIRHINQAYSHFPRFIILLEYEAFSVAQMNVPREQSQDMDAYCM